MVVQRCRFASNRKVQRMCRDGVIDCYKLQTTRNGQPVAEWLVNEASLRKHIEENEVRWDGDAVRLPAATGNASQPPYRSGDASDPVHSRIAGLVAPDAVATPDYSGDAASGAEVFVNRSVQGDAVATPDADGDASETEVGETRSLASLLIENARLTAALEGTRQLIEEIREDKDFLRDELKEARAGRKDVTAIAQRMLETLETIAIGGRLSSPLRRSNGNAPTASILHANTAEADVHEHWAGDNSVRQPDAGAV